MIARLDNRAAAAGSRCTDPWNAARCRLRSEKMHVTGQTAAQGASVQCMQAIETERSPGLPIIDRDDTAAVDPPRHLVLVLAGSDAGIAVDASVAS
jgi:hypothetical protein